MSIQFNDYTPQVQGRIKSAATAWLYEATGEVQSQAQRNTRVQTGGTKSSWSTRVDGLEGTVGSNMENAIWEEFGTGIHAEGGGGRATPWSYQAPNGKWYTTRGKKGTKALRKAFRSTKPAAMKALAERLRGLA